MIVRIDASGAVSLDDAADLKRLHVEAADAATAGDALAAAGAGGPAEDGHVALAISWLRAASAGAAPADEFDAMIGYATSKGWVDVDAQTVRAHLA